MPEGEDLGKLAAEAVQGLRDNLLKPMHRSICDKVHEKAENVRKAAEDAPVSAMRALASAR